MRNVTLILSASSLLFYERKATAANEYIQSEIRARDDSESAMYLWKKTCRLIGETLLLSYFTYPCKTLGREKILEINESSGFLELKVYEPCYSCICIVSLSFVARSYICWKYFLFLIVFNQGLYICILAHR